MIFLLYWLGYAAAFGTAACYAAYKTALVQRTLAAVARRGLRGLVHDITNDSEGCTIVRTESGTVLILVKLSVPHACIGSEHLISKHTSVRPPSDSKHVKLYRSAFGECHH